MITSCRSLVTILILNFLLFSCDGRTSSKAQLEKSVSEFSENFELLETHKFYPNLKTKIETDSLIADTFNVKIKNYSTADSFIQLNDSKENKFTHHRIFKSDILVTVKDDLILKRRISAENFSLTPKSGFWDNATLEHVWVNQKYSDSEFLSLGISIINPKLKSYKLYELRIDKLGNEMINLIEENS